MANKMGEDPFITEREFSRVDTCVPFEFAPVAPEEVPNIRSRISMEPSIIAGRMPDLEDEALAAWLRAINSKLDVILNHLVFQREGFADLKMRPLNISGGGMSFTSNQTYRVGDVLEIRMMLNMSQPIALYLYGKVVKTGEAGPPGSKFDTAIKFIEIADEVANAIVRFVFEVQREELRKRKE